MLQLYSKGTTNFSKRGLTLQALKAEVTFQDAGRYDLDVTISAEGAPFTFEYGQVIRCSVPKQTVKRIKLGKFSYYEVNSGESDVPLYVSVPISQYVSYQLWKMNTEYNIGDKVTYNDKNYRAIHEIRGIATIPVPPASTANWQEIPRSTTSGGEIAETLDAGDVIMKTGDFNSEYMEAATLTGTTGFIQKSKVTSQGSSETQYYPAQEITEQSFIITEIEKIQNGKAIYLHAEHISYQLGRVILGDCNVTRANPATALMFMRGAMKQDYPGGLYTNIREEYVSGDWSWKNAQSAIMDPKDGILASTSGMLIRNDLDYFLIIKPEATPAYTINYGNNQKNVKWDGSVAEIVTQVWPIAQAEDGSRILLPEEHIDTILDIPFDRPETLDTKLKVGQKEKQTDGTEIELTQDMVYERMRTAANNRFTIDECDRPDITLEVDWIHLPDSEEYKEYAALKNAAPGDWVLVKNGPLNIATTIQLTGYTWDALLDRYVKCSFGKKKAGGTVASYDLKSNAVSGRTLATGSVGGNALRAGSITTRELAANSITADKIASRSISAQLIQSEAITADEIAANAISAEKIRASAITSDKIAALAITTEKLAAESITTEKLAAGSITTHKLAADSITAEKIKADAVTAEKIKADSITAEKIKAEAVTAEKIKAEAITTDKLKANAVTANKIAAQAITTDKLDANAVTAGKIAAGAITADKIDAGAVTAEKIAAYAITAGKIAALAITSDKIDANAITAGKIAANAVTSDKIDAYAITTEKLAAGAVTAAVIASGAIETDKLAAGSVTAVKIASQAITTDKLDAGAVTTEILAADAVTSAKILAGAITTDKIDAGAVTTAKLDAYAVTAGKIAAGAVEADKIAAGAIDAEKIDTTDLVAIHAALGTASIVTAAIQSADISYLQVKDLDAQSAYFGQAVFQEGIAGKLFIPRLNVVYAQIVSATIGDLVIQASDDNFYKLDVSATGAVTATQVTVTQQEIEDGHTSDGKTIYLGTDIVAEDLSTTNIYATHALMDEITAGTLDVGELFARSATIQALNVVDLSSNTYIQSTIGNWTSGSTITQTISSLESRIAGLGHSNIYYSATEPSHENLVVGDIWIKPEANTTWGELKNYTWGYVKEHFNWIGVYGVYTMYTWNGSIWRLLYDSQVNIMMETEIQQLNSQILLKANRADMDILSGQVTTINSELSVQAGQITALTQTTNAKATSYYGDDDPSLTHTMHIGDIWYKEYSKFKSWADVKANYTWRQLKELKWKDALAGENYVWNGSGWVLTSDRASEISYKTLIDQTTDRITLMAQEQATIAGNVYENRAQITITANQIEQEVIRATNSETTLSSRITQTADKISQEVTRATQAEGVLRGSITTTAEAVSIEVSRATQAEGALSASITTAANNITLAVQNGTTAAGRVVTVGSYITIQTTEIRLASGGNIILEAGALLQLSATQIKLTATQTLEDRLEEIQSEITAPGNDTTTEYCLSNSSSSVSGGYSWQATIPQTIPAAAYIWSRKKILSPSGTTYTTAVLETGLSSATYYTYTKYAAGASTETAPDSGWSQAIPTPSDTYPYIWVRVISVTKGSSETIISTYYDANLSTMDKGAVVAINIANGTTSVPKVSATGMTIDGNAVNLTSTGVLTVAANGTVNIQNANGNNAVQMNKDGISIASGASISIASGGNLTIAAGGVLNIAASQIYLTSTETLGSTLTTMSTATGTAQTTANSAVTAAATAQSTANTASAGVTNIANGTTSVPRVESTGISINGNSLTVKSTGTLTIAANAKISVATGGAFELVSNNLIVNSNKEYMATLDYYQSNTWCRGWKIGKRSLIGFDEPVSTLNLDSVESYLGMRVPEDGYSICLWVAAATGPSDAAFRVSGAGEVTALGRIRVRTYVTNPDTGAAEEKTVAAMRTTGVVYCASIEYSSSRSVKHDVRALSYEDEIIDKLQPVSFIYNRDKTNSTRYGLIYEDTEDLLPVICHDGEDGKTISYVDLVPVLLNEVQKLRARVKALEAA